MNTNRSSTQQPLALLARALKAAVVGIAGTAILGLAFTLGYRAEQQSANATPRS